MTDEQANHFADNLRRLKDEQDVSWRDLADAIGHRNTRYVQALAAGSVVQPRRATLEKIASVFGVTPTEMMGEK